MPDPNDKRTDKAPAAPRGLMVGQDWPAWRYSATGEAQIFKSAEDVPEGWEDHPAKFKPEAVAERRARAASLEEREADLARREVALRKYELERYAPERTAPQATLETPKPKLENKAAAKFKAGISPVTATSAPKTTVIVSDDEEPDED